MRGTPNSTVSHRVLCLQERFKFQKPEMFIIYSLIKKNVKRVNNLSKKAYFLDKMLEKKTDSEMTNIGLGNQH